MRVKNGWAAVAVLGLGLAADRGAAQGPPPGAPAAETPNAPVRRSWGLAPTERRPPGDPAQIARGKTLYGVSCTGCHGADLRGGDMGGPNLLRSEVALSDQNGELIIPVIQGGRQSEGMPAVPMSPPDEQAVAAYVRSVVATIGNQGRPPSIGKPVTNVLVGDAGAGEAYFTAKCSSCHSATGDLRGIANKIPDPKALQNMWVAGGARARFGAPPPDAQDPRRIARATVTLPSGETVQGNLVRIDDFVVSIGLPDGTVRTVPREGDVPKVEVHDPMQAHRDLLTVYTDKDIHDVTAYLVTLK